MNTGSRGQMRQRRRPVAGQHRDRGARRLQPGEAGMLGEAGVEQDGGAVEVADLGPAERQADVGGDRRHGEELGRLRVDDLDRRQRPGPRRRLGQRRARREDARAPEPEPPEPACRHRRPRPWLPRARSSSEAAGEGETARRGRDRCVGTGRGGRCSGAAFRRRRARV
jgi:hypothetical protein